MNDQEAWVSDTRLALFNVLAQKWLAWYEKHEDVLPGEAHEAAVELASDTRLALFGERTDYSSMRTKGMELWCDHLHKYKGNK